MCDTVCVTEEGGECVCGIERGYSVCVALREGIVCV